MKERICVIKTCLKTYAVDITRKEKLIKNKIIISRQLQRQVIQKKQVQGLVPFTALVEVMRVPYTILYGTCR
jgi:hypothetical protein